MSTSIEVDSKRPAILVAEDNEVLRKSMVAWLEHRFPECRIHPVASGEAALEAIGRVCPELVLMDISLPGMNGIEATRLIRARIPRVDIVVLTSHDTPQHRLASVKAGAAAFIPKQRLDELLAPALARLQRVREFR